MSTLVWSPDGRLIALATGRISVLEPDGHTPLVIGPRATNIDPSWT